MLCTCLILVVMLIGFGIFKNEFHKFKNTLHVDYYPCHTKFSFFGRPFFDYANHRF
ncbi:hypothetical protein CRYUN_Cryun09bG0150000 [Craigia yunnanensis]